MSESSEKFYITSDYMRMHPSMCYRKIGDGTEYYDCIYLMLQAIIDNSIDEFKMGYGNRVEFSVDYTTGATSVRDYGRGVPVEKLDDCFIAHDGGGMYATDFEMDHAAPWSSAMKVSALSAVFQVQSVRDGEYGRLEVRHGKKASYDTGKCSADERNGLLVRWTPDTTVLPAFTVVEKLVVKRIKECAAANPGLKFFLNGLEITMTE